MLQSQLQAGCDSSLAFHDVTGCVNFDADMESELAELSTDSEESFREKREDVKKEQSIQDCSWGDSKPNRTSSHYSPMYKYYGSSCQSSLLYAVKTVSKNEEKNKDKDSSPSNSNWSPSPGMDKECSSCSHSPETKRPEVCRLVHSTVMTVVAISLAGSVSVNASLRRNDQKAEVVANLRAKEASP
ncbi:UNVERIFIED_CONTAM: hypothetical protein H355_013337 [Colinus virginianus]|nr:hypothetical protein H355_013337 [Colinus virginianus]